MEKEQILSELVSKIGKTSLSSRTIETYVNHHMPSDGTEPDDAYWTSAVEFLTSLNGQFSHDVADEVKKFKDSHKPDGDEGGSQEPKPNPDGSDDDLRNQISALTKRLDERDKSDRIARLRRDVEEGMRSKGASDAYVLRNVLREAEIDESKSVDELVTDFLAKYDSEYVEAHPGHISPRNGGDGGRGATSAADAFFKAKKEREGWDKQ